MSTNENRTFVCMPCAAWLDDATDDDGLHGATPAMQTAMHEFRAAFPAIKALYDLESEAGIVDAAFLLPEYRKCACCTIPLDATYNDEPARAYMIDRGQPAPVKPTVKVVIETSEYGTPIPRLYVRTPWNKGRGKSPAAWVYRLAARLEDLRDLPEYSETLRRCAIAVEADMGDNCGRIQLEPCDTYNDTILMLSNALHAALKAEGL